MERDQGGNPGRTGGTYRNPAANPDTGARGTSAPAANVAWVDPLKCTGCGLCAAACPLEAIHLEDAAAVVDAESCTGCGIWVDECPNEAIALIPAA
jgi:Pyruvate/2-oxoacid:ferredoxin oxidoreductase delta subunit